MQRLVLAVMLVLAAAPIAWAQGTDDEMPTGRAVDEKPRPTRKHEVLAERPSGFWTSNRPAKHGAYRYRMLLIGLGLMGVTGFFTWRLVRKTKPRLR